MTGLGMETLRPGDIGFGPIGGFVPGFFPVDVGQLLLAERSAIRGRPVALGHSPTG